MEIEGKDQCHFAPFAKKWEGFYYIPTREYMLKCDGFDERMIKGKGKALREEIWESLKK